MTNIFLALLVVTAYIPTGHKTASGRWPEAGISCAAPVTVPFGTWLYVDGDYWRVDDRCPKFPQRIDLCVKSRAAAMKLGKRKLKVYRVVK